MSEQKYTEDGYLIVSETDKCPLWERDTVPCRLGYTEVCFFCKFADFRTEEFRIRAEEMPRGTKLYSICQNEKKRNKEDEKEDNNEN